MQIASEPDWSAQRESGQGQAVSNRPDSTVGDPTCRATMTSVWTDSAQTLDQADHQSADLAIHPPRSGLAAALKLQRRLAGSIDRADAHA
jgi:hypothetical protein